MEQQNKRDSERYSLKALKKNKMVQQVIFIILSAVLTVLLLFVAFVIYLLIDFYS